MSTARRASAVVIAVAALAGFAWHEGRAPQPQAADLHEQGRAIYNFRCYFCHGYSGDAKTLAASYLTPKPRDFTAPESRALTAEAIAQAVAHGKPGTAMKSFDGILDEHELRAVAAFVEREFVRERAPNTAYHIEANGWANHDRFADAARFARGETALDATIETLDAPARQGRTLFLAACVSCHDRARVDDEGPAWSARPVSYPRMGFVPGDNQPVVIDAVTRASPYAQHDVVPRIEGLDAKEKRGEALFQANCAFCHGADGTGKNWIGQFMEPKARDLTQYTATTMPPALLRRRIREGLPGTSMPAWQSVLKPAEVDAVGAYVARAFFGGGTAIARSPP